MDPLYKPEGVEARWQKTWEEEGLYHAEPDPSRESYVICVPPPNVTGALHMGHALNGSIQDALIRWHRMRGFNTLWQPGYDHAGIATQAVVERELANQGITRQEIGRDAFVEKVWEWLREYGGVIMGQFRRLGASLDYSRERFTMDDDYIRAVMRFFVHLYERGWIYRANRIINWCPVCATAISDLEVEHVEMDDTLSYVRYPFADGDGYITVATVRPPTILADVAVAVHPDDDRYRDAIGREVLVPVVERRVPVIADERVEPEFGTGALKITPGHDPTDFAIGRDHGLPEPMVIGLDGLMNEQAGELAGLTQDEAERVILDWLKEHDRLEKREHYRHSVGTCARTHNRIEPLISLQWWCEMEGLARPAIEALQERRVRYHPESQHRFAIDSLETIPDWCLSRQLWWGHQLPIWYCPDGHVNVADAEPEACAECGTTELERDPDVLDTWFSSALWPFATLGWPDQTPELASFYPGDVNVTAREIIRLWENRMIMSGLELMGEIPFTDVIITSTVLAPDGRRMSKSLGNGVDPLEAVDRYGADATRYGLLKISSTQDVRFSWGAIEEGRKLANKLWNVSRLILQNVGDAEPEVRPQTLEERWILARLDAARAELEDALARFDFAAAYRHALPHHLRRLLRLVRRGDQAAALRRAGPGRERYRARGVGASLEAPPSGDASRDGRDLGQPAGPRLAADRGAVARAGVRVRGCRGCARRSAGGGADLPPLRGARAARGRREADLRRGRPAGAGEGERQRRGGARAAPQGSRALGGDARERALRRERTARGGRGRAREARPLPAGARCPRRLTGSPGSRPGPRTASGSSGSGRCSPSSASRSAAIRRSTSSARTASRR